MNVAVDELTDRLRAEEAQVAADLAKEGTEQVTYAELVGLDPVQLAEIILDMGAALAGAKYVPATGWHEARMESERVLRFVVKLTTDKGVGA